jgi:NAD(P)H-hydrate epimerase
MAKNSKKIYVKRNPWAHKGQFGNVLIVGGSKRYSGSPVFNAMGALRSGADLITIIGYKRAMDIAASFAPDIITYPLDTELESKHIPTVLTLSRGFDSLIIGGGLNRSKKTYQAIRKIIKKIDLPMVIDAEAIRAVAENPKVLANKKAIITPHTREFKVLTGQVVKPEIKDRQAKVKEAAKKLGAVILLKGHIDVISEGEKVGLNKTGSAFMTKGGFGDTLAGITGALLARGIEPFTAAQTAAYINGKAGEMAAKKFGEGVIASDIFEFIPKVIKI